MLNPWTKDSLSTPPEIPVKPVEQSPTPPPPKTSSITPKNSPPKDQDRKRKKRYSEDIPNSLKEPEKRISRSGRQENMFNIKSHIYNFWLITSIQWVWTNVVWHRRTETRLTIESKLLSILAKVSLGPTWPSVLFFKPKAYF